MTAAPSEKQEINESRDLPADLGVVRAVQLAAPVLRPKIEALGGRYIPNRPSLVDPPRGKPTARDHQDIWFVKTPPPPTLPDESTSRADALMLAEAYRQAVEARWPSLGRCYAFRRGDIEDHKQFGQLAAAAAFMRSNGVTPIGWALFSCDVWKELGITDGPPTTTFMFSHARLVERLGWYEERKDEYVGGTAMACPELVKLFAAHDDMWRRLIRENPTDRPSVLEIVDQCFPNDTWEHMVEAARQGQRRLKRELDEAVARGVCVWA